MNGKYIDTKTVVGTDTTDTDGCSVYTLAATCDMSYQDAQKMAEVLFYRRHGRGARSAMIVLSITHRYKNGMLLNGHKVAEINDMTAQRRAKSGRVTLAWFAKNVANEGKWYCLVNGHAVAIIDGYIFDNMPEGFSDNRLVFWAAKMERVVEAE